MSRLIDADALRAEFPMPEDITDPNQALVHITGIWAEIDNAPTIEERKTGKWVAIKKGELGYSVGDFRCTACERPCPCYHLTPYCPNCGAKMRGKR